MIVLAMEMNTRLAWPWVYGAQSGLAILIFLVICGLLFLVLGLITSSLQPNGDPGMVAGAVIFLILAWLVLQALPHTDQGLQFVPLLPWFYPNRCWQAVSLVCWSALLLGSLTAFATRKNAAALILVALGLNAVLSFAGSSVIPDKTSPPFASCRTTIAQCETLRQGHLLELEKLAADRQVLVDRIRSLGLKDKRELMKNSVGRTLADELEHLARQEAHVQSETSAIESVVERARSVLRRIEREVAIQGLSAEAVRNRMSEVDHELQEELRRVTNNPPAGVEVRMDGVLDEVWGNREGE